MASTVLSIVHKSFDDKNINQINPTVIPSKGDKINMGFNPYSTVISVVWDYLPTQTNITVIVD